MLENLQEGETGSRRLPGLTAGEFIIGREHWAHFTSYSSTRTVERRLVSLAVRVAQSKKLGWTWNTNSRICRSKGGKSISFLQKGQALKHLWRWTNIMIIKPADKGPAVVMLSREEYMYIKEANHTTKPVCILLESTHRPNISTYEEVKQCVESMYQGKLTHKKQRIS